MLPESILERPLAASGQWTRAIDILLIFSITSFLISVFKSLGWLNQRPYYYKLIKLANKLDLVTRQLSKEIGIN